MWCCAQCPTRHGMQNSKLLFVSAAFPSGRGAFECYTQALLQRATAQGVTCHLVHFASPLPEWYTGWLSMAGATIHSLPYEWTEPERPFAIAFALRRLLPPDPKTIIHLRFPPFSGIAVALRLAGYRHIFISDQHSYHARPLSPPLRWLRGIASRLRVLPATQLLALSSHIHRRHLEMGIRPSKTRVLHIGCDLSRFQPATAERRTLLRERLGYSSDRVVVCYLGRLSPEKGVDVLIRACASLRPAHPSVRLLVVGYGPAEKQLRNLADELNIMDICLFAGGASDPVDMYQSSDIFVCPSVWAEGFGYVNIEAMATGLPVVASATGGIADAVQDRQTGLLVPPGDVPALAKTLTELIADPALRHRFGAAGRRRATAEFSLEESVEDTWRLYRFSCGVKLP